MKSTEVDADGTVRCPKCGANTFMTKRTVKGKIMGGALLVPKRLKCNGCGTNLKRGGSRTKPKAYTTPAPETAPTSRAPHKQTFTERVAEDTAKRKAEKSERVAARAARKATKGMTIQQKIEFASANKRGKNV
ncbi:MAG: hypothetical protein ACXVXJ_05515 [Mycobacteriaceae bacterium]